MADSQIIADPTTPTEPSSRRLVTLAFRSNGKRFDVHFNQRDDHVPSGLRANEKVSVFKTTTFNCDHAKHRIARMARKKALKRARRPKGAVSSDSSDDDIMTSPDSKLVDADLVGILSSPATWKLFDDKDKAEIRKLVPDHIPVDHEGLPTKDWLRYNPDWQQALRLFQADLKAGREDPQWKLEAAKAMEERAEGKFDAWKEREFEAYWGQKAKPPIGGTTKAKGGKAKAATPVKSKVKAGEDDGNMSAPVTRSKKFKADESSTPTPANAKAAENEMGAPAVAIGTASEAAGSSKDPKAEVDELAQG